MGFAYEPVALTTAVRLASAPTPTGRNASTRVFLTEEAAERGAMHDHRYDHDH